MLHRISWRVVLPAALTATFFSFPAPARSQGQETPSVAEAARRAREQKKKPEKPARVIDDDNLKPHDPTGPPDLQTAKAWDPGAATSAATPSAGAAPEEKKDAIAKFVEAESMKAQLEALEKELDRLKRELPLERDNYYSKTDFQHDTAGKAKLDALQQQLTDKQQDVDALKTRLATMLEQLAREQPASTEKPATPPQP